VRELDQKLASEALNLGENYKKLKSKKENWIQINCVPCTAK
jgi:hypothetical protein